MTDIRPPNALVRFAVYDPETGRIICSGNCAFRDLAGQGEVNNGAVIEGDFPFDSAYVDLSGETPIGRARPTFPVFDKLAIKADGNEVASLALPVAATVTIDGVAHAAAAEPLRFTADSPGAYAVGIEAWPYLPANYVIVAS